MPVFIRCPQCGGMLDMFPHHDGRCPVAEKRESDTSDAVRVSVEVTSKGVFLFAFPSQSSYSGTSRFTHYVSKAELEFFVRTGATYLGWESGPNLNLNPSNIPTRAQLETACGRMHATSVLRDEPTAGRSMTVLGCLKAYATWLPDHHRCKVEHDLKFLERRLEELYMYRAFMRGLRKKYATEFAGRALHPSMVGHTWELIRSFARSVYEAVGIDLWDEKQDNTP